MCEKNSFKLSILSNKFTYNFIHTSTTVISIIFTFNFNFISITVQTNIKKIIILKLYL